VVLLGQDSADQADQGVTAGEDPDDVSPPAYFPVEALLGVVGPDLAPQFLGKLAKARTSARAASRCAATVGSLLAMASMSPVVLGVHGGGVGLVIDRVQQRLDPGPGRLRGGGHQV